MTRPESYTRLAWEIARRADFEVTYGGGVKATAVVGGPEQRLRLEVVGPELHAARERLAVELDRWAEQ